MESLQIFNLNWIDYTIIGIIFLSTCISLARGFVKEFISLLTWIVAFWIAFRFNDKMSIFLSDYITSHVLLMIASFGILFIGTLIVGSIVNFIFSILVIRTGLSGTDKSLGMIFGLMRGILLVSVILLLATSIDFTKSESCKKSLLIPHFEVAVNWLKGVLPKKVDGLSDMVDNYQ